MSRRKQAKPRSLKQEGEDWERPESSCSMSSLPSYSCKSENVTSESEEGETSASETTSEPADSEIGLNFGSSEPAPYPCQFCDKAFSRYSYLKKHEQSHSGLLLFRCDFCSRLFKHKRSRDRHIKLHTGDKKYKCTQCEAAFSRSDHLKIHMKTHDNQKPYQCVYCNRGYNTAAALTSHLQNHKKEITSLSTNTEKTSNSIYRCLRCNIIFTKSEELYMHMATKHPGSSEYLKKVVNPGSQANTEYSCICCSKDKFPSMEQLRLHIQEKHASTAALSDQTKPTDLSVVKKSEDLVPPNVKKLRMIESSKSSAITSKEDVQYDPGTLLCNQCNAALPDFESFRNHLKTHLEERGLSSINGMNQNWFGICPYCRLSTSSLQELIKHISSHILRTVTEYSCQICKKLYRNSNDLERHLIEVHSHHLYLCYACKEVFDTKYEIQRHFIVKHFNEIKKFRCCICPTFPPINSEVEFDLHVRTVHCGFDISHATPNAYAKQKSEIERKSNATFNSQLNNHFINMAAPRAISPNNDKIDSDGKKKAENVQNNNNNSTEVCGLCELGEFKSKADLTAHCKLVHHTKDAHSKVSLQCAYCNENCKSRSELENHMKLHCQSPLGFGKHKCNICDEICHSAGTLAEHKLMHCKVVSGSTCSHCKASITTEENFLNHMMTHNNCSSKTCRLTLPVPCVICRQTLVSESETRLHAKFHLQTDTIRCSVCLQIYGRNDFKDNICIKCFEEQKTQQNCSVCNAFFESKEDYDKHREVACSPIKHCEYKCNICLLIMTSSTKLQAHLIEHTFFGSANFTCYICNAVFTVSTSLQQHILQHNNAIKPYICIKCKMQFFFRAELENHMYIHQYKTTQQDFENKDTASQSKAMNGDNERNLEAGNNNNLKEKHDETSNGNKFLNGIKLKEEPLSSDDLT